MQSPGGGGNRPHVVILGAGFGGLAAARTLENEAVDVTIVDRNNFHTFQPLLYQVATAGLNVADVAYPVRSVFRRHQHVAFRQGTVVAVDWDGRALVFEDGPALGFDHLVVAAGSSPNYFGTPGAEEHGFPLYSLAQAARLRNHVLRQFEAADVDPTRRDDGSLTFVVVGGGPTGVEVAGSLAELIDMVLARDFHTMDARRARVILVEAGDALLAPFAAKSRKYARRVLSWRGVDVRLGQQVERVSADRVHLAGGEVIPTRTLVWAAGIQANPIASVLGVAQGRGGRITVDADLSIPDRSDAYAVGDIADIDDGRGARLPQLAQVAMQGGEHAARQVLHRMAGRPSEPFGYFDKGIMATIGRRAAVAELPVGPRLTGAPAWLAWLGLHLVYLMGMRNRVSVLVNWSWNYLTWDRGPRLIFAGAGDGDDDGDDEVGRAAPGAVG
jgi:NADH dehydrogenase